MLGPEWHIVTTPEELEKFYAAIAAGKSNQSLLVVGPTSTGKTEIAKRVFKFIYPDDHKYPPEKKRHALYFDGGGTPAQLYTHAFRHADRTLFIDDPTSSFVKNADGKRIWKQLFATSNGPRQITWQTKAAFIEREELQHSFWTQSQVVAVCNEFGAVGPDIEAVKARAICIFYNPNLQTRLRYAASWAEKEQGGKEVMKWLRHQFTKGIVRNLHQRHVFHALGYKRTADQGMQTIDWKKYLLRSIQDESLDEAPNIASDVNTLLRWAGEKTDCGVFTVSNVMRNLNCFKDAGRRDAAIAAALRSNQIHQLPVPGRPRGTKIRLPKAVYCLGPDPKRKAAKRPSTKSTKLVVKKHKISTINTSTTLRP